MAIPVWQPSTLYPNGYIVRSTADLVGGVFNDVDNGGFETGTLADFQYVSNGGTVVAQVANTNARTGLYAFYWPGGAGSGSEGGVECFATSEDVQPVNPGLVVSASGWFRYNTTGDIDGSQARMWLVWYDSGMNELPGTPGTLIKGSGNNNQWRQSIASGIPPAGAAFVAAAFWCVGRGGRGHVYVDDITWNYTNPDPPEGLVFKAVQPGVGTSDATEPVWPTVNGLQVTDGTVIWEAIVASRITYKAVPILKSGTVEPTWPTTIGQSVADNTISWQASTRQVVQAPNSKVWAITASKVYAADGDIIKYSATVNPLDWETADDAGYLPSGLNQNGSNDTAVLNIYRSSLVSFSSTTFQNWQVDPDPANMSLLDVMEGIGSTWQHAAQPVAKDLFYLAALGVRTVGISAGSTNLVNGDVGMPIDPLVRAAIAQAITDGVEPRGLYYPSLGQYWLSFPIPGEPKTLTFVYSMTTLGQVGAWSWYEFPWLQEGEAMLGNDLYIRSGDSVFIMDPSRLDDQNADGEDVPVTAEIQSHYLDFGSPGVTKMLIGCDLVGDGVAQIALGFNQTNLAYFTPDVEIPGDTVPGSIVPIPLSSPSFAMRIRYVSTDNPDGWEWLASNFYVNDFRPTS